MDWKTCVVKFTHSVCNGMNGTPPTMLKMLAPRNVTTNPSRAPIWKRMYLARLSNRPRPSEEPILPRPLLIWLGVVGLVLGLTTLGMIWGVTDNHGAGVGRTMGFTTFSIMNIFFAFACKDELKSMFDTEVLADSKFLMMSGFAALSIVAGTELGVCQRFLHTESLSLRQWMLCILAAGTVIVATEARKFVLRRRAAA